MPESVHRRRLAGNKLGGRNDFEMDSDFDSLCSETVVGIMEKWCSARDDFSKLTDEK